MITVLIFKISAEFFLIIKNKFKIMKSKKQEIVICLKNLKLNIEGQPKERPLGKALLGLAVMFSSITSDELIEEIKEDKSLTRQQWIDSQTKEGLIITINDAILRNSL